MDIWEEILTDYETRTTIKLSVAINILVEEDEYRKQEVK